MRAADRELLPALAHELGNLLAAMRLAAHLLPHEADPAERAEGARRIEALTAEAGALAALLRPLAGRRRGCAVAVDAAQSLETLREALCDADGAARVEIRPAPARLAARVDPDALHHALASLVRAALAASPPEALVAVAARRAAGAVVFAIEDAGREDAEPRLRGRALRVRLADAALRASGGGVDCRARRGGTRVQVRVPAATPPSGALRPRAPRPARTPADPAGPRSRRPRRARAARSR